MTKKDIRVRSRALTRTVLRERLDKVSTVSRELHRGSGGSDARRRLEKELQDRRQNLLREIDRNLLAAETPKNSIFISYSGSGKSLGEKAKKIADEYGLHAKTGFDAEVELKVDGESEREESLPHAVMAHIISCDCFLGIWTEDFDAASRSGADMRGNRIEQSNGFIPSVWMPFELGVAASHGLPFRLLVVQNTHRLYYEKPFQFQTQIIFERDDFEKRARKLIEYLSRKVQSRRVGVSSRLGR